MLQDPLQSIFFSFSYDINTLKTPFLASYSILKFHLDSATSRPGGCPSLHSVIRFHITPQYWLFSISNHISFFPQWETSFLFLFPVVWYSSRLGLCSAILSKHFFNIFLLLLTLTDLNTVYSQTYISSLHPSPCSMNAFPIVCITSPFECFPSLQFQYV